MVYMLLGTGFEETEAICPIDIMLRAGIEVELISVSDDLTVKGTHGIDIKADKTINHPRRIGSRYNSHQGISEKGVLCAQHSTPLFYYQMQ